ncbi:hypothetical protein HDE76_001017 [Rhodanobacter sp. ANJX3]|uniref:PDZ domain-containing protein n=1 Tax=unclassified Rhodanobacter TaxID=2621553 RepID=UPI0015C93501|nr:MULTISPECIES: PDZ domain-containing protein [unclassified Rhodanobacter]MBB5357811.1 hypothetical protein [Rhodanobacter sp. ANJX3]NYE30439.1 hypothetical protein [Rhodanobacter sp. K2T2]
MPTADAHCGIIAFLLKGRNLNQLRLPTIKATCRYEQSRRMRKKLFTRRNLMRRLNLILCGTLLAAAFTAMPVYAGWYTSFHNTHDSLVWHNSDGRTLELHSDNGAGVEVTKVSPANLWGLQKGDVLLSVDDHAVKHVDELFKQLQASKPADVKIQLRRSGSKQMVTIPDSDYTNITNPHP